MPAATSPHYAEINDRVIATNPGYHGAHGSPGYHARLMFADRLRGLSGN